VPITINKAQMTSVTDKLEETPFLFNQDSVGKQITAIKIDKNKGLSIGEAAFIPAIIMHRLASVMAIGCFCVGIKAAKFVVIRSEDND